MSTISVTNIADGDAVTAASINNQINTIVNDYNGNVTAANLAANTLPYSKLAATIFSSQVLSQANAGGAGGTMYYINLGGIKLLWLSGATVTASTGSGTGTVTFPTSFFSTIQFITGGIGQASGTAAVYTPSFNSLSATGVTVQLTAASGSGSEPVNVLVIGT